MIVLDASAVVELLLGSRIGRRVAQRIREQRVTLHAPHLLDVEVVNALRSLDAAGATHNSRSAQVLRGLGQMLLQRHGHAGLLPRAWELRHDLSTYDAVYVALAEALDAPLITCDARVGNSPGHRARIEVIR